MERISLSILLFVCGASSARAATFTVVNLEDSGAGSLRAAIADAQAGDEIVFDDSLRGQTITLTSGELAISKDLDIEGPGAEQLAISGNQQSRIFNISSGNTVTLSGLTLTRGLVTGADGGGAILNTGGNLTLTGIVVSYNRAIAILAQTNIAGGAVTSRSNATLTVIDSIFIQNQVVGSDIATAFGGAIQNNASRITISGSTFIANEARGGSGGHGGSGRHGGGGAVNNGSALPSRITNCLFVGNRAVGGDNGIVTGEQPFETTGGGQGGAIRSANSSDFVVETSFLIGNQAIGGNGGYAISTAQDYDISFGYGGGLFNFRGTLTGHGNVFIGNQAIGGSHASATFGRGHVGDGSGGGMLNLDGAMATVTDCFFFHNEARGGDDNVGGTSLEGGGAGAFIVGWGQGGAITNEGWNRGDGTSLTMSNVTLIDNQAVGGAGNSGNAMAGAGVGGGLTAWWIASTVSIEQSRLSHNKAIGANGANGVGGALAAVLGSVITVAGDIVDDNLALGGDNPEGGGGKGLGGGAYIDAMSTTHLERTVVTRNNANGGAGSTSDGVGAGGGVYNLGQFDVDDPARVHDNHASTSDDDIFTL